MIDINYNRDTIYCGKHKFFPYDAEYYVHIYRKKDFSDDNRYLGYIYENEKHPDNIVYKGELLLTENNGFIIDGKCDEMRVCECDNKGKVVFFSGKYTGEIQNQTINGYGILTDNVGNSYEGIYHQGIKRSGYFIINKKEPFYYKNDRLKYYIERRADENGDIKNVFVIKKNRGDMEITDVEEEKKVDKLFKESKSKFEELKNNYQKNKENYLYSSDRGFILYDKTNNDLMVLKDNNKNNNKNYDKYPLYLNYFQFKERVIDSKTTEQLPEGKCELFFFIGNQKLIYIKGEMENGILIKGTKYYMGGLKEYEGGFKDNKPDGLGIFYNKNGQPQANGLWEKGEIKTGIRKQNSVIEIGDFKKNNLCNGIRIIKNVKQKYCEIEYWKEDFLKKTDQVKNFNNIEEYNYNTLLGYYKLYLYYLGIKDDCIENDFIIKNNIIKLFYEEDGKAKININNSQPKNFLIENCMEGCLKCCSCV